MKNVHKNKIFWLFLYMKKTFYLFLIALFVISCGKQVQEDSLYVSSDTLLMRIMQATIDDSISLFDITTDINAFIDTMQMHALTHPERDIRVGAKSFAGILSQILLDTTLNTPDEVALALDSFVVPLSNVTSTWYYEYYLHSDSSEFRNLSQEVIKYEEYDNSSHITLLDVSKFGSLEWVEIKLPNDPVAFTSVAFANNLTEFNDNAMFYREDAVHFEQTEEHAEKLVFDENMIANMLTHDVMYIGYIDIDTTKTLDERYHSCMVLLHKFQEQYKRNF
jgi:hypothetical protein